MQDMTMLLEEVIRFIRLISFFFFFGLLHQSTVQSQADFFYNKQQKQNKTFKMNLTTLWTPVIIILLQLAQIIKR